MRLATFAKWLAVGVKHLNPRQGITTRRKAAKEVSGTSFCVKHLNPRQGITTAGYRRSMTRAVGIECETPKSPPGDYNPQSVAIDALRRRKRCETPKSPPGDYNRQQAFGIRNAPFV